MNLKARLVELERKLLPSPDHILIEKVMAALGGDPTAREELVNFLKTYDPGDSHLDQFAHLFLAGPRMPDANPLGETIQ